MRGMRQACEATEVGMGAVSVWREKRGWLRGARALWQGRVSLVFLRGGSSASSPTASGSPPALMAVTGSYEGGSWKKPLASLGEELSAADPKLGLHVWLSSSSNEPLAAGRGT